MEKGLNSQEISQYKADGHLFPNRAMDTQSALSYRAKLEDLERRYLNKDIDGKELNQFLRVNAHQVLPLAAELASTPAILDLVESIIGSNILVWSCEFFIKEANTQKIVSWHQDLTYWGLGEKDNADTDDLVTAWLALSPATTQSGCMKFVAGSHKQEIQPHKDTFSEDNLLSRGQEIAVEVDERQATDIVLQPGEFSLHHGRTFHASGPNNSDDRRIGVAIRYVSPHVRQLIGKRDYAMLVRGFDKEQNWINIAAPEHEFSPSSLALYNQVLNDQAAALTQDAEQSVGLYQ